MNDIFFTADLHLYHKNIIKYCNRGFSSIEEMNEKIINNINSVVSNRDSLYILGDLFFNLKYHSIIETINSINGIKHVIIGNHDKKSIMRSLLNDKLIESVNRILMLKINDKQLLLSHRPDEACDCYTWHLFGHTHQNLRFLDNGFGMNVGVDCNNFYPYYFEEIVRNMNDHYQFKY